MPALAEPQSVRTLRQLVTRSVWVFTGVVLLTVIIGVTNWTAYVWRKEPAWIIDVAGRQCLFVERMTKAALALSALTDVHERERAERELSLTVDEWEHMHRALQTGDPSLGLLPANQVELRRAFQRIEPQFQALRQSARTILELAALGKAEPLLLTPLIDKMLTAQTSFLVGMEDIIFFYRARAGVQQYRLMHLGFLWLAMLWSMVGCSSFFVLRPVVQRLALQMVDLAWRHERLVQEKAMRIHREEAVGGNEEQYRAICKTSEDEAVSRRL